jgi:thiol-disulfide isomerase/thioredoxin
VIPADTRGSTKDLIIYDNVSAIVSDQGEHSQIPIGTLIRVGETWKVLDLPATLADAEAGSGYFFQASMELRPDLIENTDDGRQDLREWIDRLDEIDRQLATAGENTAGTLNARRGDVIEELIENTRGEDRKVWIRQFADTVSAAVQSGTYPKGTTRLANFYRKLVRDPEGKSELAYVKYQLIASQYAVSLQGTDIDYAKVQQDHHEKLKTFIDDFPTSPDTAIAMLQLGLTQEFAGQTAEAIQWYRRVVTDFPQATQAAKATGAASRLECVGKSLPLSGRTLDGKDFDLAEQKGKVVVIHCWASWCDLCKQDIELLQKAQIKYARKQLTFLGINLDQQSATARASKTSLRLNWPQLHDSGLESDLANQLGILTLPTMFLIDADGKVVRQSIHISELDSELSKLLR